jgi:biotin transport system substrate-specific component
MMMRDTFARTQRTWSPGAVALKAFTIVGWAYLVALSAQLRVTLPFSPVPITAQTFVVLLGGAVLGARSGALAAGLYLVGGIAGLPFFAGGALAGPTGGYLVGFIAGAYVVGLLTDGGGARLGTALLAFTLGHGVIYAFGLPWLALFVGWRAVLPLGLFPFVVGDAAKTVIAASIASAGHRGDHRRDALSLRD